MPTRHLQPLFRGYVQCILRSLPLFLLLPQGRCCHWHSVLLVRLTFLFYYLPLFISFEILHLPYLFFFFTPSKTPLPLQKPCWIFLHGGVRQSNTLPSRFLLPPRVWVPYPLCPWLLGPWQQHQCPLQRVVCCRTLLLLSR